MITLRDVEGAQARIRDAIYLSPCGRSETLSRITGNSAFLKLDNLQMTGAFKERGALNKLLTLTPEERSRGVIAASAGNHGQAVAYHAGRLGVRSVIYMPLSTPLIKVTNTRDFGAEVVLHGASYDEACEQAQCRAGDDALTFVHAFDDDAVIAGQGTLGLEVMRQVPQLDAIVVPIGGGGLIGGLACAAKEASPGVRVVGVQAARFPSMLRAMEEKRPVTIPAAKTIAEGIAVRCTGERTLPLVMKYVDEVVTVEEEEIASAILLLLEREKTLAEGAGAAALAALMHGRTALRGKKVCVLVTGGNIDVTLLNRIIERGLVKDGRLLRLRILVGDHPGALERLAGVIGRSQANIVETVHHRSHYGVSLGETAVDITMETRGPEHVEDLKGTLRESGYQFEVVN